MKTNQDIYELHDMMNIGPNFERELKYAGVHSPEDLYSLGSKRAFMKLKRAGVENLTLRKLACLEGAIQNCKKFSLTEETKADIQQFFEEKIGQAK